MKKIKYVYLLSAPHSGSTLIAALLGCHKDISTVGEFGTDFPKYLLCSCGKEFANCNFWREIKEIAHKKGINVEIGNLGINLGLRSNVSLWYELYFHLFPIKFIDKIRDKFFNIFLPKFHNHSTEAIEKSLKIIDIILDKDNSRVFLDTTKNPFQVRFLSKHPRVDLKIIYLIRDGRAVTWSLINKEKWSLKKSVDTWLWSNRNIERVCSNYINDKTSIFMLKLEDFCNNPEEKIKQLLDFIGVSPNIDIKGTREAGLHIIGNSMRLKFSGKIRRPDESWKENLTKEQLLYFKKRAGWLNRYYGYE